MVPAPIQVRVPSNDPGAPDMVDVSFASHALGRMAQARLLLPIAFDAHSARRFPVLYLLHGANEPLGYRAWTEQTHIETLAMTRDVIVVMPEAGQAGWYSDWSAPCAQGSAHAEDAGAPVDNQPAWETFHLVELEAVLTQYFQANEARAVAGVSMGGLGATSYAARHPGMFSAAASYSGALHTSTNAIVLNVSLQLAGCSNTDAVWGSLSTQPSVWAEHDPYELAGKLIDLPLYVSVGNGMPGPLDAPRAGSDALETLAETANHEFVDHLMQLGGGTRLTTRFYGPGTHSWPYWSRELEASFSMLMASLGA